MKKESLFKNTTRAHSLVCCARPRLSRTLGLSLAAILLFGSSAAWAGSPSVSDLQKQIKALEAQMATQAAETQRELQSLKAELKAAEAKAAKAPANTAKPTVASTPAEHNPLINFGFHGAVAGDFVASDAKHAHTSFVGGKFLPIVLASYSDWLLFEGHLEFTTNSAGETETSLEYAQADFLVNNWLTIAVGKFLSPIGQFQQALHPPWINKLPDRPVGFVEDGGDEPLTDVGIMARGGFPIGSMKATYAVYVGNGPRMDASGPTLEGFGGDNNGNKAVGGRVSLFVLPHLEIGLSGMHSAVKGMEGSSGPVSQADYHLIGGDFAFTKGNWDIRGEYIYSHLGAIMSALDEADPTMAIPSTTWRNWYAQAAYRLAGISDNPVIQKFEPVVRYSRLRVSGIDEFKENEEDRWSVGLDYWFAPSIVAKIAFENRDFPDKATVHMLHAQVAFGF